MDLRPDARLHRHQRQLPQLIAALLPALLPALLFCAHALWRASRLRLPAVHRQGRVTLILAATGPLPGLEALCAALAAQTLRPRRLVVGVESDRDPAHARLLAAAALLPFPVELRLAGEPPHRGQKSSNLIAALAALDAEDDAVVLFDADIRPQPWWLSAAASPAIGGEYDVVTGFRWQVLSGRSFLGQIVAWIDRLGAVLILPPRFGLVWGGTIGLSRRALATLDLPRVLDRTLIDDLAIGKAAARAKLRILSRGALVVPTPAEGGSRAQLRFLRRQLQVVRIAQPIFWALLVTVAHLSVAGWAWALLALPDPTAAALLLLLALLGLVRADAHGRIGAAVGAPDAMRDRLAQAAIAALPPLGDGLIALLGWTMLRPRRLRWRHVEYEVRGPQHVRVLRRFPHAG